MQLISHIANHCFSFLPACVDACEINLGVGVLVQDPMIMMTLNLSGWHLKLKKKVRLEQNLIDCAQ